MDYKKYIKKLNKKTQIFLAYVNTTGNECAYSDRMVEDIIKYSKHLEKQYNKNS